MVHILIKQKLMVDILSPFLARVHNYQCLKDETRTGDDGFDRN